MRPKYLLASVRLGAGRNIDESQNAVVAKVAPERKLAEVLVQSDEDSLLVPGEDEEGFIAGIFRPVSDPDDVVPAFAKFRRGLSPYACVQQELHFVGGDSMVSGSMRSFPT